MQAGQAVQNPIINFYNDYIQPSASVVFREVSNITTTVSDVYDSARRKVVDAARENLSESLANIVDRVSRVFPEVLVVASAITGFLTPVAFFYATYKLLSPVAPELAVILNPNSVEDEVHQAKERVLNSVIEKVNNFIPAVSYVCTAASVALGITGLVTLSPTRLLNAQLFGLTAFCVRNAGITRTDVTPHVQGE